MACEDVRESSPLVGDHVELVRDGELDVAPGVGEELRQLGLFGGGADRLGRQVTEQRGGALAAASSSAPTICGSVVQLLDRVPLGDALRAERDVDRSPGRRRRCHVCGRARVDRAAEDDQRAVAKMRGDWSTARSKIVIDGSEELVHGRADDDHDLAPSGRSCRSSTLKQAPGRRGLAKELIGAGLQNGISPRRSVRLSALVSKTPTRMPASRTPG